MYEYYLAGLGIRSDIELPLSKAELPGTGAEVSLSHGPPLPEGNCPPKAEWNWPSPDEASLSYPRLGMASISEGKRILLRPYAGNTSTTEWRGLLIPCFAALFHQRGALSLHASAVYTNGQAVGFMGYPGAGKSTLVAQLVGSSFSFLCDDLLLTSATGDNRGFLAHPGFRIIKLWEDAVRAAGAGNSRIGRLYPDADKDGFTPPSLKSRFSPAPLKCLFVLEEGDRVKVETLSRPDALAELLRQTYGVLSFKQKPLPVHFRQCGELAARIPVKRLIRPKTFAGSAGVEQAITEALDEDRRTQPGKMPV